MLSAPRRRRVTIQPKSKSCAGIPLLNRHAEPPQRRNRRARVDPGRANPSARLRACGHRFGVAECFAPSVGGSREGSAASFASRASAVDFRCRFTRPRKAVLHGAPYSAHHETTQLAKAPPPSDGMYDTGQGLVLRPRQAMPADEIAVLDCLVKRGSTDPRGSARLGDCQSKLFQDCLAIVGRFDSGGQAHVRAGDGKSI